MNEFVAKKIGEVMAFSKVGVELLDKGELAAVFGDATVDNMKQQLQQEYDDLLRAAGDFKDTAKSKSEKTAEKLHKLANTYVGDEWDNPVEVMEWLGFFEGAAIVHCSLIQGAAAKIGLSELTVLATQARGLHHDALEAVSACLREAGAQKAGS